MEKSLSVFDKIKQFFSDITREYIVSTMNGFKNIKPFTHPNIKNFDFVLLAIIFTLLAFGLGVHYSASLKPFMDSKWDEISQFVYAIIGIVSMMIFASMNTKCYKYFAPLVMGFGLFLLVVVFLAPTRSGTHRWLLFFQPSEVVKIFFIMYLAFLLDKHKKTIHKPKTMILLMLFTLFVATLVLLEKHLSGAIMFGFLGLSMIWLGGANKRAFLLIVGVVFVVGLICVLDTDILRAIPGIHEYQVARIDTWKKILSDQELTYYDKTDSARQVLQSLYAIGSGGFFGKGYGNSAQKISNLQEESNDFIFAVLAEELGFVGSLVMLALFAFLVIKIISVGLKSKNYFNSLYCIGIAVQISLQVLINVMVATSTLPNTGISLPFFSSGGSSLFFTLTSLGLVLGIARDNITGGKQYAE